MDSKENKTIAFLFEQPTNMLINLIQCQNKMFQSINYSLIFFLSIIYCATFPVTTITMTVLITRTIIITAMFSNNSSLTFIKPTADGTNKTGIIKISQSATSSIADNGIIFV